MSETIAEAAERSDPARVEAFSDGVLAIVITLLVLELKLPPGTGDSDGALLAALAELLPRLAAWVVSFLFVLVFWVSHHALFAGLARVDRGLLWLNGLFLLAISFTPFPTGLAGEHPSSRVAVALLAGAFLLSAAAFAAMRWYATAAGRLVRVHRPQAAARAIRRSLLAPLLYALAVALALLSPLAAGLLTAAVPLLFVGLPLRRG